MVDLIAARIGDQVNFNGASVTGLMNMSSITVGQDLLMSSAHLEEVRLARGSVGGVIDFTGSIVAREVAMYELQAGKDVLLKNDARFGARSICIMLMSSANSI